MLKRLFTALFLLTSTLTISFSYRPAFADRYGSWDGHCPYPGAPYYAQQIFPRFERATGRVVAVSWKTGEIVQPIDQGLSNVIFMGWSPDCRYVVGGRENGKIRQLSTYHSEKEYDSFVWDMVSLRRIATFPDVYPGSRGIQWEPSGRYAVVGDHDLNALYLWNIQTQQQFQIDTGWCPLNDYYFDMDAGQLLAVRVLSAPAMCSHFAAAGPFSDRQVSVISLQTGQEIGRYGDPSTLDKVRALLYFSISPDHTKLALYSPVGYLVVVDRATGALTELEAGTTVTGRPTFSQDNHYLVSVGFVMRVWDLTNIAPDVKDRVPIYRIDVKPLNDYLRSVPYSFVDAHMIRIGTGTKARLFDLVTGQFK